MSQFQVVRMTVTTDNQKIALVRIPDRLDSNIEELISAYRHELYAYAFRMLRDHDEAEEVTQEAIVRAYEYLERPYHWVPLLLDSFSAAEIGEKGGGEAISILRPRAWLRVVWPI